MPFVPRADGNPGGSPPGGGASAPEAPRGDSPRLAPPALPAPAAGPPLSHRAGGSPRVGFPPPAPPAVRGSAVRAAAAPVNGGGTLGRRPDSSPRGQEAVGLRPPDGSRVHTLEGMTGLHLELESMTRVVLTNRTRSAVGEPVPGSCTHRPSGWNECRYQAWCSWTAPRRSRFKATGSGNQACVEGPRGYPERVVQQIWPQVIYRIRAAM